MMSSRSSGSAQYGLSEWLVQRVSALYLAGFVLWLTLHLLTAPPTDYVTWKAWFGQGGVRLAFALAYASVLVHTWVGVRSVLLDYLKPAWLRLLVQLTLGMVLLTLALWATQIILSEATR